MAIVEGQKVKVKITNRNRNLYLNLNYEIVDNEVEVGIDHLPKSSNALVKTTCDFCNSTNLKEYRRVTPYENHFCNKECNDNYKKGKEGHRTTEWAKLSCSNCDKKFERPYHAIKPENKNNFCCRECADDYARKYSEGRPMVERLVVDCDNCGKELHRTASRLKQNEGFNNFCDKKCADEYKTGKILPERRQGEHVNCYQCNESFYLPQNRLHSAERHFCSNDCYYKWKKESDDYNFEHRKTGEEVPCKNCGGLVYRKKFELEKQKFHYCSMECKNEDIINWELPQSQRGERITVNCYNCGVEKHVVPSVYEKNQYFFCSTECFQGKRIEITGGFNTATSIHLKITDLLEQLNIRFTDEKHCGYYNLDIYLDDYDLYIEVMGDYWHSNPLLYKFNNLNEMQRKRIITDKRKNTFMKNNYTGHVLYLWETDINNNLEMCEQLINLFIKNNGKLSNYQSFNYCLDSTDNIHINNDIVTPYFELNQTQEA